MQIVTLTTDFGQKDYYAAVLKGAILSKNPTLNIVDISHNINNYDIVQAAYIFKNAWKAFPKGTIHLISVGESLSLDSGLIAFPFEKHFFVGPNNGIFSLVFSQLPKTVYALPKKDQPHPEQVYANTIGQIV